MINKYMYQVDLFTTLSESVCLPHFLKVRMTHKKLDILQINLLAGEARGLSTLPKDAIDALVEASAPVLKTVFAMGGDEINDNGNRLADNRRIMAYDWRTDTWTEMPYTLPPAYIANDPKRAGSAQIDDRTIVMYNEWANDSNNLFIFRPDSPTGKFTNFPSKETLWRQVDRTINPPLALRDGRLLCIGGKGTYTREVGVMIIADEKGFRKLDVRLTERHHMFCTVLENGDVLMTGGNNYNYVAHADCYIFRVATNTLDKVASMNHPRAYHSGCLLPNGDVMVVGGQTNGVGDRPAATEIYNVHTNTWTIRETPLDSHGKYRMVPLPTGKILVFSGQRDNVYMLYDPVENRVIPRRLPFIFVFMNIVPYYQ